MKGDGMWRIFLRRWEVIEEQKMMPWDQEEERGE